MTNRRIALVLAVVVAACAAAVPAVAAARPPVPVLAYYYIWFNPTSWNRAKIDYPLVGRYSSDETAVMRKQVRMARQAGINGFLVSWKSTPVLDRRLARLVSVARSEHFHLGIIYEGLDFSRHPLAPHRISHDLRVFRDRYGSDPVFRIFHKPVVVWSGTWRFSREQIDQVAVPLRRDLLVLGTEKNPAGVERLAGAVDGDAYYWSSVNPATFPRYEDKLQRMANAVHDEGGLWVAPAAPGFDARLVGGQTIVPRADGATFRREITAALGSSPDALGIISWNEFSENSHIEPSVHYRGRALEVLADALGARPPDVGDLDSSAPAGRRSGYGPLALASLLTIIIGAALGLRRRQRGVIT